MTPTDQRLREIAERENKATNADYDPLECLSTEVERFKATNQFTPMQVTGFYLQAACVITELRAARILIKKQREALEHIVKYGESQCKQLCAEDYIPRGLHAPDCPLEYIETARDALNFSPENL